MENDPLGNMNLSAEGIIERDFIVFSTCIENHVPVAMVLSGGYQRVNAPTIADSIRNII
jgi:histone deacetylase 11